MPSQREQYGSTVHLFIGTGRSPCRITLMPFTFINNSIVILRGLICLFIFKSVPFSAIMPKLFCAQLRDHLILRHDRPPSHSSFVLTRHLYTHNLMSEDTCSHISLGKHCQIMFLRTFGSRRPPTPRMHPLGKISKQV